MAEYKTHTEHELKFECSPVWPGEQLCFQYLAIFSNEICPKAYKLHQSELKTLPKTK